MLWAGVRVAMWITSVGDGGQILPWSARNVTGNFLGCLGVFLRGPVAILFISRDTCSDSITKLFCACFYGVSHNYRAIRCKMRYRTDVPA